MGPSFINLTTHIVSIVRKDGSTLVIPHSGHIARVAVEMGEVVEVEGVEIASTKMGALEGLDGLVVEEGMILITSLAAREVVKAAYPQALVVSPGPLIRGADGQPTGCQGLAR